MSSLISDLQVASGSMKTPMDESDRAEVCQCPKYQL